MACLLVTTACAFGRVAGGVAAGQGLSGTTHSSSCRSGACSRAPLTPRVRLGHGLQAGSHTRARKAGVAAKPPGERVRPQPQRSWPWPLRTQLRWFMARWSQADRSSSRLAMAPEVSTQPLLRSARRQCGQLGVRRTWGCAVPTSFKLSAIKPDAFPWWVSVCGSVGDDL